MTLIDGGLLTVYRSGSSAVVMLRVRCGSQMSDVGEDRSESFDFSIIFALPLQPGLRSAVILIPSFAAL